MQNHPHLSILPSRKVFFLCLVVFGLSFSQKSSAQTPDPAQAAPVAPLQSAPFGGWTNCITLENDRIQAVIAPEAGRLIHLSLLHQANLLRQDSALAGQINEGEGDWINHGGDWFWPSAQTNWPALSGHIWPPVRLIDGRPWEGRGWRSADGSQHVLISQDYPAPLAVQVSREFSLHPTGSCLRVTQTARAYGDSEIPVTLWNITQVAQTRAAFLPYDSERKNEGIVPLMFGDPEPDAVQWCHGMLIYTPEPDTQRKLGSQARSAWIAALRGDTLLLESASQSPEGAVHPDGDLTVEMFSLPGMDYVEIETLSEERLLKEGDVLQNELRYCILKRPDAQTLCDWAQALTNAVFMER